MEKRRFVYSFQQPNQRESVKVSVGMDMDPYMSPHDFAKYVYFRKSRMQAFEVDNLVWSTRLNRIQ